MSGCYRCGLSEGSESRLCETCFSHRFNRGEPVVVNVSEEAPQGPELTTNMKRWLLSSGAALYIGVVGFGVAVQGEKAEVRKNAFQPDVIQVGGNEFPVNHDTQLAFLAGPLGDEAE